MSKLQEMILADSATIEEIAGELDDLEASARVEAVRSLGAKAQRKLWTLTAGRAVTLEDIVPSTKGPLEPVIHYGKNSLPLFSIFEKRFCRPPDGEKSAVLWGYNEGRLRPIVGPGYFVCRPTPEDERGTVVIDYYQVPPGKPESWPKIEPNDRGITRLVYGFMHDFLRKVSIHVTIGRAYKHGKVTNNYFLLCREA
ncbi:MAG: hypothetical protein D6812_12470 [Deltaproteobacteria bacterium]|nr:MAG: hypothetical protein D6812_12470 [Deltaproteobacteria bacterium]